MMSKNRFAKDLKSSLPANGGLEPMHHAQYLDSAVRRAFISGIGSKLIVILLGVLSLGISARGMDIASFGVVATLVGLIGIFGFLDFGIGNGLIHRLSQLHAREDVAEIRAALANALAFLTVVGIILGSLMVILLWTVPDAWMFGAEGHSAREIRLALTVFALGAAVGIPVTLGSRLALALQRGYLNNLSNLAAAILTFLGVLAASVFRLNIIFFVASFILVPALTNLVQTWWLMSRDNGRYSPAWSMLNRGELKDLMVQGLPFMALGFAGAATYQSDSLIVIYIVGAAGAGVFGLLAKVFSSMTTLFAGGLQQLWASTAHALAVGDLEWVRRSFLRVLLITTGFFAVAAVLVVLFGQSAMAIWAGDQAIPSVELLLAFAIWYTYNFVFGQISMLLNGANIVRIQALCAVAMAIVNVPLSIFLTHEFGLPGPLYGSLVSHLICVGVPTFLIAKKLLSGKLLESTKVM
jgi:O-antigen/teichoic acid export membrane protein